MYKTKEEQEECLKTVLTGDDEKAKLLRQSSLEKIKCLNLPENINPEKYIHSIIINLKEIIDDECNEIIGVAKEIVAVDNSHKYVDDIISRLDWDRGAGLSKIIDLVSSTQDWANYVANVKDWLTSQIPLVQEVTSQEV